MQAAATPPLVLAIAVPLVLAIAVPKSWQLELLKDGTSMRSQSQCPDLQTTVT
jgi:hypothetical protein